MDHSEKEMTTMPIDKSSQENIPNDSEAYCEELAGQEEIYLEETEEEVRAILISDDQVPSQTKAEYWRSKIVELELDWE
jgi:hypothetical protein